MRILSVYCLSFGLVFSSANLHADDAETKPLRNFFKSYVASLVAQKELTTHLDKRGSINSQLCPSDWNQTYAEKTANDSDRALDSLCNVYAIALNKFVDDAVELLNVNVSASDFDRNAYLKSMKSAEHGIDLVCSSEASIALMQDLIESGPGKRQGEVALAIRRCLNNARILKANIATLESNESWTTYIASAIAASVITVGIYIDYRIFKCIKGRCDRNKKPSKTAPGEHIKRQIDEAAAKREAREKQAAAARANAARQSVAPAPAAVAPASPVPRSQEEMLMQENGKSIRDALSRLRKERTTEALIGANKVLTQANKPGFKLSEVGEAALRDLKNAVAHNPLGL